MSQKTEPMNPRAASAAASARRVRPEPYPLAADTLEAAEIDAAKAVLDSGFYTMGRRVKEFEYQFADWVGAAHAVMVNSGSSANLLLVDALLRSTTGRPTLQPGDEVLVPGLAWPTTVWPISQLGLVPVFVDVDPKTLAIDLESAAAAIGPRTRGMFLIYALGRAADRVEYNTFCEANGLTLIEDCCESLGAHSSGRHVGTTSLAGSFSFYFSHHVSTIEGGMIVTNDLGLADDLRGLRAHGWIRDRTDRAEWIDRNPALDARFLFATMGYNVRPTEIQAAIGSVQLARLDGMLRSREELARQVHGWLGAGAPWLELVGGDVFTQRAPARRTLREHSWMTLPFRLRAEAPVSRAAVMDHLERNGVETRPLIAGSLARHPAIAQVEHRLAASLEVCDGLLENAFMIGCHPNVSDGSRQTLERAIAALGRL